MLSAQNGLDVNSFQYLIERIVNMFSATINERLRSAVVRVKGA